MANTIEIILKATDNATGTMNKLNSSFKSLTGFSMGAAGGIALATKAIQAGIQYTKEAIEANDKYVTSIVDMARFTGDEVDAMSRLVQVADDVFLSQEALNNAMSIGAKKGLDMSVQGIKDLADQYNALGTQQEKNLLLNENFGRSGIAMGKLLEQGADGITSQMNAIASNLVVTKNSVDVTYEYKKSVDGLNDAMDGLKYTVAQQVMPAITDLNTVMTYLATTVNENDTAVEKYLKFYTTYLPNIGSVIRWVSEGISQWADDIEQKEIIEQIAIRTEEAHTAALNGSINALIEANKSYYIASDSVDGLNTSLAATSDELSKITSMFKTYTQEMLYNKLATNMDADAALALSIEMGLLDTTTYSLMLATDELTGRYDINRDGVISLTEMTAEYKAEVMALKSSVDLLQDKTIKITVDTIYNSTSGPSIGSAEKAAGRDLNGNGKIGFANGGSFTVPSWAGYEGFNMGGVATASAGETVTVNKAGSVNNNDVLSATLKALPKMIAREIRQLEKYG